MEIDWPILVVVGLALGVAANLAPGPGIRLTVRAASRRGPVGALDGWAGGALVDLLLLTGVVVLGLPSLVNLAPEEGIRWCLRIVGGGALVGAGWDLMERRAQGALYREAEAPAAAAAAGRPLGGRIVAAISSPFALVVKISAGAGLLFGFAGGTIEGAGILAGGFFLGGLLLHAFVGVRIGRPRGMRALSDRQFSVVASLFGLGLVGLGLVTAAGAVGESGLPDTLSRMIDGLFG